MRFCILLFIGLFAGVLSGCSPNNVRDKEIIIADKLPALGPYSTAVKANGMLYISGIIAFDPSHESMAAPNIEAQTRQVFANLIAILNAAGCNLDNTVKINVFLKNPEDMKTMNGVYKTYFKEKFPARTTVPGVDWGREDILIEIDAIVLAH